MAKTFVKDIREGEGVNGVFLIDSAHLRYTKANKAYLKLVLGDKSGQIEAVMWEETMEKNPDSHEVKAGDFTDISGQAAVNRYAKRVEVVVNQIRVVDQGDLDVLDFLPKTEKDLGELEAELKSLVKQVDDPDIKKLLNKIFDDPDMKKDFNLAPAAKNYHHAYLGGLLEHSVSVGKLAVLMCDHYQDLDKPLLIAGALLHDLGKVRELIYSNRIDYSTEGRLKGHIVIGDQLVATAADSIEGFPKEKKMRISHLVLSHQGELEYGAAIKPKTREAVVLNIIDNMDAKVNGWLQISKKYGDDVEWTDFQSMFGDFLYLGPSRGGKNGPEKQSKPRKTKSKEETESTLF